MTDLIHYVYNGNSARIFSTGHTLRFLFASYFNPKMIYNLIGFFDRTGFTAYEIVVVSEEKIISEIKTTLSSCSINLKNRHVSITYSQTSLTDYLRTALTRKKFQTAAGMNSVLFDYIEYTYGMSIAEDYESELSSFKQLLQPEGVIGLTYFAKNHHVDNIRKATSNKNTSALIPFCMENSRFIKSYLDLNGMSFLTRDQALLWYLGAESAPHYCPVLISQVAPSYEWTGFTQSEVLSALSGLGLRVASWLPHSYAHPFGKQYYIVLLCQLLIVIYYRKYRVHSNSKVCCHGYESGGLRL